jgi:hypothetical protein
MNCRRLRCDDCRVAGGLCLICGWIRRPMMPQSRAFTRTRRNTACGIQHLRTSRRSPILGDVLCSASAQLPAETRDPDGAIPTTCGGARGRTLPGAASGETITCDVPGGSGAMHRQHVCPNCLTRTHSELLAHPEVINVRPGTLDTPATVAPLAQIWTSLALPWALLPNIPHYEENPPDVPALMGSWRETHSAKLM